MSVGPQHGLSEPLLRRSVLVVRWWWWLCWILALWWRIRSVENWTRAIGVIGGGYVCVLCCKDKCVRLSQGWEIWHCIFGEARIDG